MSFEAKKAMARDEQLKVQELVLKANSPMLSVVSSDLVLDIGETVVEVRACLKQVVAGTVTGIAATVSSGKIVITGESAAVATTSYIIKYVVA